ncbi:MAG: hypothetical protein ACQEQV_09580 [Fibrobacterota bacterium]
MRFFFFLLFCSIPLHAALRCVDSTGGQRIYECSFDSAGAGRRVSARTPAGRILPAYQLIVADPRGSGPALTLHDVRTRGGGILLLLKVFLR